MALQQTEERCFDGDFEFDAPQWIDFESERNQMENVTNRDQYDWWFEEVHPSHSPHVNSPEPQLKMPALQKSVLSFEGTKLSSEKKVGKCSLPTGKSSLAGGKTNFIGKSTSFMGDPECRADKDHCIEETSGTQENKSVKRPRRKCWELNGQTSLSFSPKLLSSIPADLQPKRCSANSLSRKNSELPSRISAGVSASPSAVSSPFKKHPMRNKDLKAARRSCPQRLPQPAWNESSMKSKNDVMLDEEIEMIIEQHNRKILSKQSEYDLNGRKTKKTTSPLKPSRKENIKPTASSKAIQSIEMDRELQELIEKHNQRVRMSQAQKSEYDLNGRRIRRGNTTVVSPIPKPKPHSVHSKPTRAKSLCRSHETNPKRKKSSTSKNSEITSKVESTAASTKNAKTSRIDFEQEIEELINLHNSRLAAKKAKKK